VVCLLLKAGVRTLVGVMHPEISLPAEWKERKECVEQKEQKDRKEATRVVAASVAEKKGAIACNRSN